MVILLMRKKIIYGLAALLCVILTGCSGRKIVDIRVVSTTDVHGYIFDKDILTGNDRRGSMAKVATFIRQERKNNKNLIYLDAGDILQGSLEAYQDVTAQYYRTSLLAEAYNILGCNAMALGNHDLAAGTQCFERFMMDAKFPVLGGNICFDTYGDYIPPYTVLKKGGVTIGIIGLTTPSVMYSQPWERFGELTAADPVKTAQFYIDKLRDKVDVLIGLFHSGYSGGRVYDETVYDQFTKKLVNETTGFDLIVFGHDHSRFFRKEVNADGDSILMMNTSQHAERVAVTTLHVDRTQGGRPKVSTIGGELVDVTSLEPDAEFVNAVSGWYDDVCHYADSIIGSVAVPLESNGSLWRNNSINDYIHQIQMGFFAAQVSLATPVTVNPPVPAGNLQIRDVYNIIKSETTLVSVMLKGSEIRDALEYSATSCYEDLSKKPDRLLRSRGAQSALTAAGINYTIDVTKPVGKRVTITSLADGTPFNPDKMYRTTVSSALYVQDGSALYRGTGLSRDEMKSRFNSTSEADLRYYILTDISLKRDAGKAIKPERAGSWKLVPEKVVSGYLAKDTLATTNNRFIRQ